MVSQQQQIADIATNKADIRHLQKGYDNLVGKIDELESKVDNIDEKIDRVIAQLNANSNQIIGAGKLAKILWFSFPALCGAFGYLAGKL